MSGILFHYINNNQFTCRQQQNPLNYDQKLFLKKKKKNSRKRLTWKLLFHVAGREKISLQVTAEFSI